MYRCRSDHHKGEILLIPAAWQEETACCRIVRGSIGVGQKVGRWGEMWTEPLPWFLQGRIGTGSMRRFRIV